MSESLLSKAIKKQIPKRFNNGKTFSTLDFTDLAAKFYSKIAGVTRTLIGLEERKLICAVGEIKSARGGNSRKIYKLSSVGSLSVAAYRDRLIKTEEENTTSALRLHRALDKITRARMARAQG